MGEVQRGEVVTFCLRSIMSEIGPPSLELLVIELNEITNWEILSVHLNLKEKYKNILEKFSHLGIDRCKLELFGIWIKTGTKVTWRTIAEALEKMEQNTLAKHLREKYAEVLDELRSHTPKPVTPIPYVNQRMQKKFERVQIKFRLLYVAFKKLIETREKHDDLREYMIQCKIPHVQQLDSNDLCSELLNQCDFLRFSLIEVFIYSDLKDDVEIRKMLKRYKNTLEKFKRSAEMRLLITSIYQYKCDEDMKLVEIKLEPVLGGIHIEAFFELLEHIFYGEYEIEAKMKVTKGCLSIQWFAPILSCDKMREALASQKHQFLEAIGIIYIKIAGETIYKKSKSYDTEEVSIAFANAVRCQSVQACEFLLYAFREKILVETSLFQQVSMLPQEPINIIEMACHYGHVEVVSSLLKIGLYRERLNSTPLMIASGRGHATVVKLLLESLLDINVNKQGPSGETALHLSCQHYHRDVAYCLLHHCEQTNLDLNIADNNEMTPLMISTGSNKRALVHRLLESGANPNITKKDGDTALHIACYYGYEKIVKQLLLFGANPCAPKADGWTPLMVAIPSNHVEIIKLLLKIGKVDPNMQNQNDGDNPLMIASWNNCIDIVEVLLSNGANPNIMKRDGWTPLIAASLLGHLSIVEVLFQNGARLNTQAKDGVTSIYVASQEGHAMVVRFLLEKGADFYLTKTDSETSITTSPLVIACQNGHSDVVELLLEKDIEQINAKNPESGATPIFIASFHGQGDIVKLLLERGADPFIKDKNHQNALDVTEDKMCEGILREAGVAKTKLPLAQRIFSSATLGAKNARNLTTRLVGNISYRIKQFVLPGRSNRQYDAGLRQL